MPFRPRIKLNGKKRTKIQTVQTISYLLHGKGARPYPMRPTDPLVAEWVEDLITRKGGEPIKVWKQRLCSLEAVCNTCNSHPSDLLASQRSTEKIMRQFAQVCSQKKDSRDTREESQTE